MQKNYGVIRESAGKAVLTEVPIPAIPADYILVRTVTIALNPTDWTTLDAKGKGGTLVGCDYAGIVEEVGSGVAKALKKGDRVAGFGFGGNDMNPWTGSFARYIAAKGDLALRIPDNVDFEAAATFAVGVLSAGWGLYRLLELPYPDIESHKTDKETILVYGGSTATGTIATQLAKLSGAKVLTTSSAKHFDLLKDRGADETFDYRSPNVGQHINASTKDTLTKILDTVNVETTAQTCAEAFSSQGGTYATLLGLDSPRKDVQSLFFLGYDAFGEAYVFEGDSYPAKPEDFVWARDWMARAEKLWVDGKLKTHPERVREGGLRGAIEGMGEMKEGKGPSGEKWVYRVDETEWP